MQAGYRVDQLLLPLHRGHKAVDTVVKIAVQGMGVGMIGDVMACQSFLPEQLIPLGIVLLSHFHTDGEEGGLHIQPVQFLQKSWGQIGGAVVEGQVADAVVGFSRQDLILQHTDPLCVLGADLGDILLQLLLLIKGLLNFFCLGAQVSRLGGQGGVGRFLFGIKGRGGGKKGPAFGFCLLHLLPCFCYGGFQTGDLLPGSLDLTVDLLHIR